MKLTKCEQCGGPTAEGLPLCPDCMRATGAAANQIAAAEELRDIARVLSITANTDANIREAIVFKFLGLAGLCSPDCRGG